MRFTIKNGTTVKSAKNAERAAWRILWFLKKSNKPSRVFIDNVELEDLLIHELDENVVLNQLIAFENKVKLERKRQNSIKSAKILTRKNPNYFRDIVMLRWNKKKRKEEKDL